MKRLNDVDLRQIQAGAGVEFSLTLGEARSLGLPVIVGRDPNAIFKTFENGGEAAQYLRLNNVDMSDGMRAVITHSDGAL